jgi:AbrB family looped-hinge helix DNA binding protein
MIQAMRATMDSAGRLVIPKKVREAAGLKPGEPLEIRCHGGRVEIEPAPLKVKLVRKRRFLVAVPDMPVEPLAPETVEKTRRIIRKERGIRD